jgi:acetolactate synthase-1/2/3 large subunit
VIAIADIIVDRLRSAGVGCIFGLPGGGSNLDLIAAAGRAGLPFVLTATETAAALAAIAHAEVSGGPGVCLTTLGPGVTSVVNGVACAWLDRAPLLVFTDAPAAAHAAFEHQRVDHRALLAPVTKWSAIISPANADAVMREALGRALAEPRGPVHIDCPADVLRAEHVQDETTDALVPPASADRGRRGLAEGEARVDAAALAPIVSRARRPLLLVGLGARRRQDAEAIIALCASRAIPAMVTYKAKGVVPDADPHFAGVFTNGAIERPLIAEADLLLGVGLDPVELIPRPWSFEQPIVHIGRARVDDRQVPFAAQLVIDIAAGMRLAGELLPSSAWDLDAVHRNVVAQRQRVCPQCEHLAAHRVVQLAAQAAGPQARVTIDAGAHMFPATMLWPVAQPNGMLISNGLSTMGFALPAAIGAALADRVAAGSVVDGQDVPVIALTGDGGLLMCAGEMLTAVRERLRVVVIVFADASLSLIDIKQRQSRHASAGVTLGDIDWCSLAASMGAAAHRAGTEEELILAMSRALAHDGATMIEARIDPRTYGETLRTIRG